MESCGEDKEDDNVQSILDQHVSRVWADLTPAAMSPGGTAEGTPRPYSPDLRRRMTSAASGKSGMWVKPRKEKDVFSTFSADSGNIADFPGSTNDLFNAESVSSLVSSHLPKSKSVPNDYEDSLYLQSTLMILRLFKRLKNLLTKYSCYF